jgi:hypothetical protein
LPYPERTRIHKEKGDASAFRKAMKGRLEAV